MTIEDGGEAWGGEERDNVPMVELVW
jgi:hypothetical protein